MKIWKKLCLRTGLLVLLLTGMSRYCPAQGFSLESAGVRLGASPTSRAHNFHQVDAFVMGKLPWQWDLGKDWSLRSRLDLSAGWLSDSSTDAAAGTLGPSLALSKKDFPLSFETGSGVTLISRHEFESKNFGTPLQFTSYVGLNFDLGRRAQVGYRFQHMSNGGLSTYNPGLNLHVLGVSYKF